MSYDNTLKSVMPSTRKIQVTLMNEEYDLLARIARREGKKLAAVVRESIHKYSILPESERAKRKALEDLFSLPPTSAPESYKHWKNQYNDLKKKGKKVLS